MTSTFNKSKSLKFSRIKKGICYTRKSRNISIIKKILYKMVVLFLLIALSFALNVIFAAADSHNPAWASFTSFDEFPNNPLNLINADEPEFTSKLSQLISDEVMKNNPSGKFYYEIWEQPGAIGLLLWGGTDKYGITLRLADFWVSGKAPFSTLLANIGT